jgi:hypothetical protein
MLTTLRDWILMLTTLRDYLGGSLSLWFRCGGRDGGTMLHYTRLCGRAGAAVRWFAAHDGLTTLRDYICMRWPLSLRFGGSPDEEAN